MNRIFGIVIIFAAAWLMFRLQAGSNSGCDNSEDRSDPECKQNSYDDLRHPDIDEEAGMAPESDTRDKEESD